MYSCNPSTWRYRIRSMKLQETLCQSGVRKWGEEEKGEKATGRAWMITVFSVFFGSGDYLDINGVCPWHQCSHRWRMLIPCAYYTWDFTMFSWKLSVSSPFTASSSVASCIFNDHKCSLPDTVCTEKAIGPFWRPRQNVNCPWELGEHYSLPTSWRTDLWSVCID